MKVKFEYKGHEIVLCRELLSVTLLIDGLECDKAEGIVKSQFSSFELQGKINNENNVHLKVKMGIMLDTAELYIDGELVETRKIA